MKTKYCAMAVFLLLISGCAYNYPYDDDYYGYYNSYPYYSYPYTSFYFSYSPYYPYRSYRYYPYRYYYYPYRYKHSYRHYYPYQRYYRGHKDTRERRYYSPGGRSGASEQRIAPWQGRDSNREIRSRPAPSRERRR